MGNMSAGLTKAICDRALELGFDAVGVARVEPPACGPIFREATSQWWGLDWLRRTESARLHPEALLPGGARSAVVVAKSYFCEWPDPCLLSDPRRARFAAYAWGPDYHAYMRPRLRLLGEFVARQRPGTAWRAFVDTGPILERHFAAQAGLGFIGRNCMLISPRWGGMLFLGVLLVDCVLEYGEPMPYACAGVTPSGPNPCGRCWRCGGACPTQAIPAPYRVDAMRCISYWTIEARGAVPLEVRSALGNRVFGCDECLVVCPWTRRFARPGREPVHRFDPDRWLPLCTELLELSEKEFVDRYHGTVVERVGLIGLRRSALIVAGNSGWTEVKRHIARYQTDDDPIAREHAEWAMRRLGEHPGSDLP